MGFDLFSILSFIPAVLSLIAQWIGLMAMRGRKGGGWLLMTIGISISSVGFGVFLVSVVSPSAWGQWIGVGWMQMLYVIPSIGGLLFCGGFAVHGLAIKAAVDRQRELEALTAAMAEELRILRQGR